MFLNKFKTSNKISIIFLLFNFISLLVLLLSINIIYFYIWHEDQKEESLYDMNMNYNSYIEVKTTDNLEAFKQYILKKDTIIIPEDWWDIICSEWVSKKLHEWVDKLQDKTFYKVWDKVFFIFSRTYPWIWEVKVFFDTTTYVRSQIIIIKLSLFIITFFILVYFFIWKYISRYALNDLKLLTKKAKEFDIDNFSNIKLKWPDDDEIKILADTINKSFKRIESQTDNLKQFITDVSHEFKTPLMIINSKIDLYNKMIEKWWVNKDDTSELLLSVKSNTNKLNKLLETLFLLSRMQEWITCFDKKTVNLSEYINRELDYFETKLIEKWNSFVRRIDKDIYLEIEEVTFNIILENLVTNAIKFSLKGWKIEIGLTKESFWVKDNWIWIEKNMQKNIFNKFFRIDRNRKWFWVWLFMVKRVLDLYNWKVELKSKKWEWSKFIINF